MGIPVCVVDSPRLKKGQHKKRTLINQIWQAVFGRFISSEYYLLLLTPNFSNPAAAVALSSFMNHIKTRTMPPYIQGMKTYSAFIQDWLGSVSMARRRWWAPCRKGKRRKVSHATLGWFVEGCASRWMENGHKYNRILIWQKGYKWKWTVTGMCEGVCTWYIFSLQSKNQGIFWALAKWSISLY